MRRADGNQGGGGEGRGKCDCLSMFPGHFLSIFFMTILGEPGAVSRVDKMFVVNRRAGTRLDLTVNFLHEDFIDQTNCSWVSEDAL